MSEGWYLNLVTRYNFSSGASGISSWQSERSPSCTCVLSFSYYENLPQEWKYTLYMYQRPSQPNAQLNFRSLSWSIGERQLHVVRDDIYSNLIVSCNKVKGWGSNIWLTLQLYRFNLHVLLLWVSSEAVQWMSQNEDWLALIFVLLMLLFSAVVYYTLEVNCS